MDDKDNANEDDFEFEKPTLEKVLADNSQKIDAILVDIQKNISDLPDRTANWLYGENSASVFDFEFRNKSDFFGYEDLLKIRDSLYKQAVSIREEKGYRFGASLLTGREHRACGSSGYGRFEEAMPDVPVPIADLTLKLCVDEHVMTIEEVRKARELLGMSTIDETGKVTGEIVEITDSYHFLSPERKAEIIVLEQRIIDELKGVVEEAYSRHQKALSEYKNLVEDVGYGRKTVLEAQAKLGGFKLEERTVTDMNRTLDEVKNLSYLEGHRDKILTPMELVILKREVDKKYLDKPYTPLGVQDGKLTVDEANRTRSEEKYFIVETDLFMDFEYLWGMSLELLNQEGITERGPILLDRHNGMPIDQKSIDHFKPQFKEVAYSRPQDVYHK